jgi:hypothetical protein
MLLTSIKQNMARYNFFHCWEKIILFTFCLVTSFYCFCPIYAENAIPSVEEISAKLHERNQIFIQNSASFFVEYSRCKSDLVTPVTSDDFPLNQDRWVLSQLDNQIIVQRWNINPGTKLKHGDVEITFSDKPYVVMLKDRLVLDWYENSSIVDVFPSSNYSNYIHGWDYLWWAGLNPYLIHSNHQGMDYTSLVEKSQNDAVLDVLKNPILPNFLEENQKNYIVSNIQEEIDGSMCWKVTWPGFDSFWIDPKIGYAVRKREFHWDVNEPLRCVVISKDFSEVMPSLWIPRMQIVDRYTDYRFTKPDQWNKIQHHSTYLLDQMRFKDIPQDLFDIHLPVGTEVIDGYRKNTYTITNSEADPFAGPIEHGIKVANFHFVRAFMIIVGSLLILFVVYAKLFNRR